MDALAFDAVGVAHRREAVNASPAFVTLAALAVVHVIVREATEKEIHAACFDQLCSFDEWIKQCQHLLIISARL